jgi:repressor LexA
VNYTPKQLQILRLIHDYQLKHSYSPTYAELAKELGVSTITVFEHLEALERKKAISRRRHEARSVEIIDQSFLREQGVCRTLPVKGILVAGHPLGSLQAAEDVPVGDLFPATADLFLLKVQGDNLAREHILDGDLLVLDKRETAADGEQVVAQLTDGGMAFGTFSGTSGKLRLASDNGAQVSAEQAKIHGVLRGLIRKSRAYGAAAAGAGH